jgi:hypothetical protein
MKTAYIFNNQVLFSNADGVSTSDFEDIELRGTIDTIDVDPKKLYKMSYDEMRVFRRIRISKIVELVLDKEIKSLEKRADNDADYRVSNPGVMGRQGVENRIRGLQRSKQRYAEQVLRFITKGK